ncbi:MAG: GIY-YIG nuclease family protein [Melioribacteraceae bacterium]|jgi:putative endonuclease|nr:GIY-YIG nuclease family protein [Melioribacteraceae bacterium]
MSASHKLGKILKQVQNDGRKEKMSKKGYTYIITNKKNGTLYIGVTSNLFKRIYEHKNGLFDGFSKKYSLKKLVYYEISEDIATAIQREKQLKNWHRDWKINLIEKTITIGMI